MKGITMSVVEARLTEKGWTLPKVAGPACGLRPGGTQRGPR
jgi:hypothetical protein